MRLFLIALVLLPQEDPPDEWPKDVTRDWAKPQLTKDHSKFQGTYRIEFPEKGKFVALHGTNGKAIIYEFKDWLAEKFLLTQAMPCTGTMTFWRNFTGEVTRLDATTKHMWVSDKERPVTVTPDGQTIAIAKNDHTVSIYDSGKSEAPRLEFEAASRGLMDLCVFGKQYLVTIASQQVRLWNLNKLTEKPKESSFGNAVRAYALARPDNRYIALTMGKYVHALDVSTMKGKDLAEDFDAGGGKVDFSDDGKFLLCQTPAQTASVYSSGGEWKHLLKLTGEERRVVCSVLHPNGSHLAWIDAKGDLHLSHVLTGFEVGKLQMPGFKAGTMTWHPGGDAIYICSEDAKIIRVVTRK
jgi:WD40 repeat protein